LWTRKKSAKGRTTDVVNAPLTPIIAAHSSKIIGFMNFVGDIWPRGKGRKEGIGWLRKTKRPFSIQKRNPGENCFPEYREKRRGGKL